MKRNKLNTTNVCNITTIYQYNCSHEDCTLRNINFIGSTTTTLSRRAIKEHITSQHLSILSRDDIVSNTEVLHMQNDTFRLLIHEAMLITFQNLSLNRQDTGCARILKLYADVWLVGMDSCDVFPVIICFSIGYYWIVCN